MGDKDELENDLESLKSMAQVVVDGQNIAFEHGRPIAKKLGKKTFFSYEAFKIVIESLYQRGCAARIVLPQRFMSKKYRAKNDRLGIIDYFSKYDVFVPVNGAWTDQHKKDDIFMLGLAFSANSKIVTNDKFRNELEDLGENEYEIWEPWIEKNRIGFKFEDDAFVPDTLSLKYDNSVCLLERAKESGVIKFWDETYVAIGHAGDSFGWSELL